VVFPWLLLRLVVVSSVLFPWLLISLLRDPSMVDPAAVSREYWIQWWELNESEITVGAARGALDCEWMGSWTAS
jgi:hypothetical protein